MTAGPMLPPSKGAKEIEGGLIPPMSWKVKLSILAIMCKGFLDVIGNYAVMPALIFYVRDLGGTESQYGLISSANSFASCLMMPVYASWVDASGNKFRKPVFVGMSLAALGMVLYTLAAVFDQEDDLAVHVLLAARLIYGIGGASGSLAVSYITAVVEPKQLTSVILAMGIVTFSGLGVAPYVNEFLADLDTTLTVFGLEIPLNPYNGVGFLVAFFELFGLTLVYFLLPEPKESDDEESEGEDEYLPKKIDGGWKAVIKEITTDIKLFLPLFAIFAAKSNYQLVEVSFPPAVGHGLGWGPVEVSETLAYSCMVMGVSTGFATILSRFHVTDTTLIMSGNAFWAVGGIAMYSFWTYPAKIWHYVAPIVIAFIGTPLIYPANQSNYYKATLARTDLEPISTRLQSIYGMTGEIANFVTPLFVGAFVLRSPEEVEEGTNEHELTSWALYAPIFATFCIIGFLYEKLVLHADDDEDSDTEDEDEEDEVSLLSERTSLLKKSHRASLELLAKSHRASLVSIRLSTRPSAEARRIRASSIMGGNHSMPLIIPFETHNAQKRRAKFLKIKKQWQDLIDKAKELERIESAGELENDEEAVEQTAVTSNKKLVVLITSYTSNPQTKSCQDRAMTILKGLQVGDEKIETIDGANAANREKRNELFGLSGIRAKYPQFFLVDANDQTTFFANYEDFEYFNETGTLKESLKLT